MNFFACILLLLAEGEKIESQWMGLVIVPKDAIVRVRVKATEEELEAARSGHVETPELVARDESSSLYATEQIGAPRAENAESPEAIVRDAPSSLYT